MNENEARRKLRFLDEVFGLLADNSEKSVDDLAKELRAEGVDVDATLRRLMGKVDEAALAAKKARLVVARERRLRAEGEAGSFVGRFKHLGKDEVLARLRELMVGPEPGLAVSWRELESRNEDDLRALLEDLELARQRRTDEGGGGEA